MVKSRNPWRSKQRLGPPVRRPSLARLLVALWDAIEKHDQRTFKISKTTLSKRRATSRQRRPSNSGGLIDEC